MSLLARCQRGWITNFVGLRNWAKFMRSKSSPNIRTPRIMEVMGNSVRKVGHESFLYLVHELDHLSNKLT